uniref:Gfo/Idh/MocA family protein n=1 Tax=Enterocloster clostridioformis TaxID=1531 RepID=UPI003FA4A6E5
MKLVSCNYSQYSSRYDAFRSGEVLPAFDPAKSGGALMDLNLYNLHWLLGLFGLPKQVEYHANMERGIDTSGILLLQYPAFQAVSIAAKDCAAPSRYIIQGTEGYLMQCSPANQCGEVLLHLNDGSEETFHMSTQHRMEIEFRTFAQQIQSKNFDACYAMLSHSLNVSKVQTQARKFAGIQFPADLCND